MAYFNPMANVKTGVQARSHFNLSHNVICTQDFSRLQVVSLKEMVPGDKFDCNLSSFVRLSPLPVPTYGNCKLVNRAFFVPMRIIMRGFDNFITNTSLATDGGIVNPHVPTVTSNALIDLFTNTAYGYVKLATGSAYQFQNSANQRFVLNNKGRKLYYFLNSLGYRIGFGENVIMSFLPVLAYARIYTDWYLPSQYRPTSPWQPYFESYDIRITSATQLQQFFDLLQFDEMLEKDYFTSAWLNPNGPIGENNFGVSQGLQLGEADGNYVSVYFNPTDSSTKGAFLGSDSTQPDPLLKISQYGLNVLKATQDYLNRNMIAGNRYIEQMLARYGVKVPESWIQRSEYLGSKSEPINISDVMATAQTNTTGINTNLGDYAGKGIGYNRGSFSYEAKEFGYFVIISCIQAESGYVQGKIRESVLHIDALDFFTPEYDCIGTQPIRNDEVYSMFKSPTEYNNAKNSGGKSNAIFGWNPRYSEYKAALDNLTGDFINAQFSTGMSSYHLYRDFSEIDSDNPLALNMSFMSAAAEGTFNKFDRIFQYQSSEVDHFICVHNVGLSARRPMRGLSESIVTEGGRDIDMPYNGYQL